MQSSNKYKVGKIVNFDGYLGEIFTPKEEYYFTKNDVVEGVIVENNDLVIFNAKTEKEFPQAYYVKKIGIKQTKYRDKE